MSNDPLQSENPVVRVLAAVAGRLNSDESLQRSATDPDWSSIIQEEVAEALQARTAAQRRDAFVKVAATAVEVAARADDEVCLALVIDRLHEVMRRGGS